MNDLQIVSGKKQLPKNVLTFDSTEQIKKTAEKWNDEHMLMEIRDRDLIAKKFRKHEKSLYTNNIQKWTIWGTSIKEQLWKCM